MFAYRRPGGKARLSAVPSGNKLMERALLWWVQWDTGSPSPAQMVFKISPQTKERVQAPLKSLNSRNKGKSMERAVTPPDFETTSAGIHNRPLEGPQALETSRLIGATVRMHTQLL